MKRTGFKPRTKPMSRGSWKRSPLAPADRFTAMKRGEMRRRIQKPTVAEGSKYLSACRGEDCFLRVPSQCRRIPNDETVVPCHDNSLAAGKGMGIKSSHERSVPGCYWCHSWLDQGKGTRREKEIVFGLAYAEWEPVRARKMHFEVNQPMEQV